MQSAAQAEPLTINAAAPGSLIFKSMIGVMRDVGAIGKNRVNTQGSGYQFRGIDDVYDELHELLAKHGVFTVPEVLAERSEERTTRSGANMIYRILKVAYTFYAEDGSSIRAVVVGEGMDSGDKASNKAMSGAHKYCFLQVFSIPTNEPKDAENESPQVGPRYDRTTNQREQQAPPPARQQQAPQNSKWKNSKSNRTPPANNQSGKPAPAATSGESSAGSSQGNRPTSNASPTTTTTATTTGSNTAGSSTGSRGRPRVIYEGAANHFEQLKQHASAKWGINDLRAVQALSKDLIGMPLEDIPAAVRDWVLEYKPQGATTKAG